MAVLAGMVDRMNGYDGYSTMTSGYAPYYTSSTRQDLLPLTHLPVFKDFLILISPMDPLGVIIGVGINNFSDFHLAS